MVDRILQTDFFWGFYDIKFYFKAWLRLITKGSSGYLSNGQECPQTRQWVHEFFNGMTSAVSRYCDYEIVYEKFC